MKNSMLRIVHISDFHLRNNDLFSTEKQIVQPLISDLKEFHPERKIDYIVCSGDLINKGGSGFENIESAFEIFKKNILNKILSEFNLSPRNLILACGNHDIDRNLDSPIIEKGILNSLKSSKELNEYISSENNEGSKRIEPYNDFISNFYGDSVGSEVSFTRFSQVFKFTKGELSIGFVSLNSSWRCYDSELDVGKLLIGKEQINFALKELKECEIKIAVTHHPLSHLNSFDRDNISPALYREFDLILIGHNHEARSETTHSLSHGLFFSYAPGVMDFNTDSENRRYSNGYRIIDFDPLKGEVTSFSRRYNKKENRFDPNTDDGDREGKCTYKLPSNIELAKIQKKEAIASA